MGAMLTSTKLRRKIPTWRRKQSNSREEKNGDAMQNDRWECKAPRRISPAARHARNGAVAETRDELHARITPYAAARVFRPRCAAGKVWRLLRQNLHIMLETIIKRSSQVEETWGGGVTPKSQARRERETVRLFFHARSPRPIDTITFNLSIADSSTRVLNLQLACNRCVPWPRTRTV